LREGFLYSQLSREEQYLDPLIEGAQLIGLPLARVPEFALELVSWTASLFSGETAADKRLRVAVCALSDVAWRDAADLRAEESFRRLLEFPFIGVTHPERVFIAAAIHARYVGRPDAPWLSPAIKLLTPSERRRAQILGRAMLLAYRFSGGVPAVLESARLRVDPSCVRLEVTKAARAPDSEVVSERLKLLASAIGIKRSEVVEIDAPSPLR
jgi:exopolyphosphatase/guanosine-5'-triphosphate,3'-diphosphate pyrophosphatase